MADGIAGFIASRLDEDQRAADAVLFACRDSRQPWPPEQAPGRGGPALTAYLKHFSENRALRDLAAKRAILELHKLVYTDFIDRDGEDRTSGDCDECDTGGFADNWPCTTLRHLAAIWNSHADYRAEWAPAEVSA